MNAPSEQRRSRMVGRGVQFSGTCRSSGQQALLPRPDGDGPSVTDAEPVGTEFTGTGDEAGFGITEGLEQLVGQRRGVLQQAATLIDYLVQNHGSVGLGVLAGLRAELGALSGA